MHRTSIQSTHADIEQNWGADAARRYLQMVFGQPITKAKTPPTGTEEESGGLSGSTRRAQARAKKKAALFAAAEALHGTDPSLQAIFLEAGVSTGSIRTFSKEEKQAICAAAGTELRSRKSSALAQHEKARQTALAKNRAKVRASAENLLKNRQRFSTRRICREAGVCHTYLNNIYQKEFRAEIEAMFPDELRRHGNSESSAVRETRRRVLEVAREMKQNGEPLNVSLLTRRAGLSRSYLGNPIHRELKATVKAIFQEEDRA